MAGSISAGAAANILVWARSIGITDEVIQRIFAATVANRIAWTVDASPTADASLIWFLRPYFRDEGFPYEIVDRFITAMNEVGPSTELLNAVGACPDLAGVPQSALEDTLNRAGYLLGTVTITADQGTPFLVGECSAQGVAADHADVVMAATVTATVQKGQTVPSANDITYATWVSSIGTAGLTVGVVTVVSSGGTVGKTISPSSPAAGTFQDFGKAIAVTVRGRTVPDPSGVAHGQYATNLGTAVLVAGTVTTAHSDTVADGVVISCSPAAGTVVKPGSAVDYVISGGPAHV